MDHEAKLGLEILPDDDTSQPVLTLVASMRGPDLSPAQHLFYYSADDWEIFIAEWARLLTDDYLYVRRVGGTGDHGLDVVGFLDEHKLRGQWDCYQCKHYKDKLTPSVAYVEIAKVILGVVDDLFDEPRKYRFVAPRGAGPKLRSLLNDPRSLQAAFGEALEAPQFGNGEFTSAEIGRVKSAVPNVNFSAFDAETPEEIIETYRKSRNFTARFGGGLILRPPNETPPKLAHEVESKYLTKLQEVYRERESDPSLSVHSLKPNSWLGQHMQRQRERFFAAESLRNFARDQVPQGTFEALQTDIHDGVIDVEQRIHPSGMHRLDAVLDASLVLMIDSNALIQVFRPMDRQGICHQLANDDRLAWCEPHGTSE